jgi:hypothetical protein
MPHTAPVRICRGRTTSGTPSPLQQPRSQPRACRFSLRLRQLRVSVCSRRSDQCMPASQPPLRIHPWSSSPSPLAARRRFASHAGAWPAPEPCNFSIRCGRRPHSAALRSGRRPVSPVRRGPCPVAARPSPRHCPRLGRAAACAAQLRYASPARGPAPAVPTLHAHCRVRFGYAGPGGRCAAPGTPPAVRGRWAASPPASTYPHSNSNSNSKDQNDTPGRIGRKDGPRPHRGRARAAGAASSNSKNKGKDAL